MNIREELLNILYELGIVVDNNGQLLDVDSILFITIIIRIEEKFNIIFPDDVLQLPLVNNINNLEIIVSNIMEE